MTAASLLIVPTEHHVERELTRMGTELGLGARGAEGRPGATNGQRDVRSWWGFISGTLARLAPDIVVASPHASRLATRLALDALPPERLRQPVEPAAKVALAHALDRAIGAFRRAGTSPDDLRALGGRYGGALAEILERADAILASAQLTDPRGAGFLLARTLRGLTCSASDSPLPREVTIRGIVAWENEDLTWVEALHAASRACGGAGVTVELPALRDDDAADPVADLLERRWASLDDAPEIAWVQAAIPPATTAISAKTPEGEARAAAAEVAAALERGTPPEKIAVLVPALDAPLLEPLRAALDDAGIRFCEPLGRPALSCPDGRAALSLLKLAVGPVSREQAIEILRTPGVFAGAWVARASSATEAERRAAELAHRLREVPVNVDRTGRLLVDGLVAVVAARRAGSMFGSGMPLTVFPFAAPPAAEPDGDADDEAWMPHALERLLSSARWIGEATTRTELVRRLLLVLDQLSFGQTSTEELCKALHAEQRNGGSTRTSALALEAMAQGARAARAIRAQIEALAHAARDLGREHLPGTAAELHAELERAAAEQGAAPRSSAVRAGAVRIDVATGAAALTHEVLVITGLDASAYGGSPGQDESMLGEAQRARLPAPCRPAAARDRQAFQRAELGWALAGASEVVVAFTRGDDGEPNDPHPLFHALSRGAREHVEPAARVSPDATPVGQRGAELIAIASGAPAPLDVAERARIERARAAYFLDPRAQSDAHTGRVAFDDEALRAQLKAAVGGARPDQPIAVTHIERAAGCAFAGFARRVLRVRRVEDLAESADARERGTLVHRALQAAFEVLRELGPSRDPAEQLAAARVAAEEALGASATMAPLRREAIDKAIADALQVVVRTIEGRAEADGDGGGKANDAGAIELHFLLAERRFGAKEPRPWHALELLKGADDETGTDETVFVDGQIDRIDRSADRRVVRVIDYKTGKIPDAKERRRALQLPLYAAVAARALGADETRALYVGVRPRGLVELWPRSVDEQRALAAGWTEAARLARSTVTALWQGQISPRPALPTLCARCDARDVCRRPAVVPTEEAAEEQK